MEEEANRKKEEEERVAQLAQEENDFSSEELAAAWRLYAKQIPSEKILLQTTLQSCVSSLKLYNNWEIEAMVDTPHQIEELEKEKVDLLTHLSQTLKNGKIQLHFRISDNGENKNSMTLQDLFSDVLKKNPAFAKLSSILGLEVE